MIVRAKDLRKTSQENLRGGKGRIDMTHFMEPEDSYNSGRLFAMATIPPGASIGEHPHIDEYEIYHVVDGEVYVTDNGSDPVKLERGDCMVCKDGDSHSIENKSSRDATMLFLVLFPHDKK
jgi:Mannose-6-phosphate isomerase